MRAVLTRVSSASVTVVDGSEPALIAQIGSGLLVLIGVGRSDGQAQARAIAAKIASLRILRDGDRDEATAAELGSEALVVSQFTLYGDTRRGRRPSWSAAAPGESAEPLVDLVAAELARAGLRVQTGRFGADMALSSVNDGPFTLLIEVD